MNFEFPILFDGQIAPDNLSKQKRGGFDELESRHFSVYSHFSPQFLKCLLNSFFAANGFLLRTMSFKTGSKLKDEIEILIICVNLNSIV